MLITQSPPADRSDLRAQTAPPVPPAAPVEQGWVDWGVAIGICIWVGNKLLGMFTQQQSSEAQMMLQYMQMADKREERLYRLLETTLMERKP